MAIEQFGYRQQLRRSLSLSDLIIYGMIFMIPIAPFGVYGWVHA
ncbi:amino acid permease, partial [Pseudomonas aeruginosa]